MSKLNPLFLLCITLVLTGCATTYVPPTPTYQMQSDSKVGVLVVAKEKLTHTHVGTTIFNNFVKEYDNDWDIKNTIFAQIKNNIERNGKVQVVNLEEYGINDTDNLDFVHVENKQWAFNKANAALRNKLLEQGINAVVVVRESPSLAVMECSAYGCSEHYSAGYGLFTRSFLGLDRYMASISFRASVETLDKAIDFTLAKELRESQHFQQKHVLMDTFSDPKNFEAITAKEFEPVKQEITSYFAHFSTITNQFLQGSKAITN